MAVGGGALALVVAAVAVLSHVVAPSPPPTCGPFQCGAVAGYGIHETNVYHSQAYGFDVHYPSDWAVKSSSDSQVALNVSLTIGNDVVPLGAAVVSGAAATRDDQQLIADALAALPSAEYQGMAALYQIPGARVGQVSGAGTMYGGNLTVSGGTATQVRVAILAAHQGDVAITVRVVAVADPQNGDQPSAIDGASVFDYLLTETVWPHS